MNETENSEIKAPSRKLYVKPRLRRVELRPLEAVLGNCKTVNGTMGGAQLGSCNAVSCMSQGS